MVFFGGLLDSFRSQESTFGDKICHVFTIGYPLRWIAMKQLGDLYQEMGMFVSAYELLNEVELTEDAIKCLFLAGRETQALKMAEMFL